MDRRREWKSVSGGLCDGWDGWRENWRGLPWDVLVEACKEQ